MPVTANTLFSPLIAAATGTVWGQWSALHRQVERLGRPVTTIDPEALILGTLSLIARDPALSQVVHDWVIPNSRIVSIQRLRPMSKRFPLLVQQRLASLAQRPMIENHDPRWRSLQIATVSKRSQGDGKLPSVRPDQFEHEAALWLRLRMAFGVGIKPDILAYLIARAEPVSLAEVAGVVEQSSVTTRRAVEELVAARFIDSNNAASPKAVRYMVDRSRGSLLAANDQCGWGHWAARFAFAAHAEALLAVPDASIPWSALQLGEIAQAFMGQHDELFDRRAGGARNIEGIGEYFTREVARLTASISASECSQ